MQMILEWCKIVYCFSYLYEVCKWFCNGTKLYIVLVNMMYPNDFYNGAKSYIVLVLHRVCELFCNGTNCILF